MRLLISIGYQKVLLPKSANYSVVIEAFSAASVVEESGPYGARVLTIQPDAEIDIKLMNDDDIKLPSTQKPEAIEKLLEIAREKDELTSKVYKLEAEIGKMKEAASSIIDNKS
jgi:hypothetical protein